MSIYNHLYEKWKRTTKFTDSKFGKQFFLTNSCNSSCLDVVCHRQPGLRMSQTYWPRQLGLLDNLAIMQLEMLQSLFEQIHNLLVYSTFLDSNQIIFNIFQDQNCVELSRCFPCTQQKDEAPLTLHFRCVEDQTHLIYKC